MFSGNTLTKTLTVAADGLVAGTTYRFILKASNEFGDSDASEETIIAVGRLPDKPSTPTKVEEDSSITSIKVSWAASADLDNVLITGYLLYMDNGINGPFTVVYNGEGFP